MLTNRLVRPAGMAVSAFLFAAAPAVSGKLLADFDPLTGTTILNAADHGWGLTSATDPTPRAGLVARATGTEDHGWG
ncbi:hypothetical protein [Streptomyces sp. NPDC093111]|uniref:hypothetical protein n=1 Tax=Streptomyces sp. NPDC093111 TaxID=3154978 RepID=UPI0034495F06